MTSGLDTTWTHAEFGVLKNGRKSWINIAAEDRLAWVYVWVADVPHSSRPEGAARYPTKGEYSSSRGVVRGAFEKGLAEAEVVLLHHGVPREQTRRMIRRVAMGWRS